MTWLLANWKLAVMAVLTYVTLCILAWRMGFRLSLAGVAGLIVTIGFTADSFIVYFERIRDELRDGKSITGAVEDGWDRAPKAVASVWARSAAETAPLPASSAMKLVRAPSDFW